MQQHNFQQGSAEWLAHRAKSKNASDAPAMLGCSAYMSRSQLLYAMHTGLRAEATPDQQRRYDAGHAIEAAQRPGAEEVIGDDLFPVVGSAVVDGVDLSASFDGLTMMGDVAYECKTLNEDLRAAFADMETIAPDQRERASGRCLAKMYRVQMEQQLAVCGGDRVLFVAATKDGSDVRRCWYYSDLKLRAEIIAGWKQFAEDLAAYVPPAASSVEKVVAEPVEALPAPVVQVSGQLTLSDNFKVFEQRLRKFLDTELVRQPKTDEDFATLDLQIKAMKGAEAALESAEAQMLAQIQSVDQAKKTKDMLADLVRKNRLLAERLLKDEKERRRGDIVAAGVKALADHIASLNVRLGRPLMPTVPADFGGCIRGLKSLSSMEDKVSTELARTKIAANEIADRIHANLTALRELASEHRTLFPDTPTLVLKPIDDCRATITSRIAEHRAAEVIRLEAERAKIRAEEEARAQRQQRPETVSPPVQPATTVSQAATNVHPMPTRAPAAQSTPTLKLGEINARLHPISIDAAGLAAMGLPHSATDKSAKLWHEHQFPAICDAVIAHAARAKLKQLEAA